MKISAFSIALTALIMLGALHCPSHAGTLPSPTAETTHWSFSSSTTAADFGPATMTAEGVAGTTDSFVTETVGGSSATVLDFTARAALTDGYTVRPGIDGAADGGSADGIEIFTMVLDIRFTNDGQSYLGIWNGNANNTNDAELFIRPVTGGLWSSGTGSFAAGTLTLNQFHRIVYRIDYLAGDLDIFVDGVIVADSIAAPDFIYDGNPNPFWFLTDNTPGETGSGQLAAFGFTNTLLSDEDIATLGSPDAAGIFSGQDQTESGLFGDIPGLSAEAKASLVAHYDGRAGVTTTGSTVDSWIPVDGSGTAIPGMEVTNTQHGTVDASHISYDGSGRLTFTDPGSGGRYLEGSLANSASTDFTVFWLGHYEADAPSATSGNYAYNIGPNNISHQRDDGGGGFVVEMYNGTTYAGDDIQVYDGVDTIWSTVLTADGHNAYANGTNLNLVGSPTNNVVANASIIMGSYSSSGYDFVGDMSQMIIFNSALSDADRELVEGFLGAFTAEPSPMTLALDKASYTSDEDVVVSWANAPGNAADWIGIYPRGVNPGPGSSAYLYVSGDSVTFTAADLPGVGQWTAWYLLDDTYDPATAGVDFDIKLPPVPMTLALDKASYTSIEDVIVSWTNAPGNNNDWIGIYPRGVTPSTGSSAWLYVSGTTSVAEGVVDGSVTFTPLALPGAGDWTAWYLLEDGYTPATGGVDFSIVNLTASIVSFTSSSDFIADGSVTLSWSLDDAEGNAPVDSLTISDGVNPPIDVTGLTDVDVNPAVTTEYTLNLNDGVDTRVIKVYKDAGNTAAFFLDKTSYTAGENVVVSWADVGGGSNDWIGLYKAGDTPGSVSSTLWTYLNGTQAGGGSTPTGSFAFEPLPEGDYFVVLLLNDGYTVLEGPVLFTVAAGSAASFKVTKISYDPEADQISLTWTSRPNQSYAVSYSGDEKFAFNGEVNDSVSSDGDTTTLTFSSPVPGSRKLFFRVSEN